MKASRNICRACETPLWKKDTHRCHGCSQTFCGAHIYTYVDGNNASITRNSLGYCLHCYAQRHPRNWNLAALQEAISTEGIPEKRSK